MGQISVSDEVLANVIKPMTDAVENYMENYKKLTTLMNEITNGDITGDPAKQILSKYNAKEETFKNLYKSLEEANLYLQEQKNKFGTMMSSLESSFR